MTIRSLLLLLMLAVAATVSAQQTPTPEQLELLRSLPEDQRQALIEEMGLAGGAASGNGRVEFPDVTRPRAAVLDAPEGPLVVVGGETLVIGFTASADGAQAALPPRVAALEGTRTYELTPSGVLDLAGVARVGLAGLGAGEIALRLRAEPALADYRISVTILPLRATGVEALDYFGYDLFQDVPTTFAPATDVPVPADYVVGPGDELLILYYGSENDRISAYVSRDGDINLPEIGPISVAGMSFDAARDLIVERVTEQMIGVRASVTLGELRSIRIFVLGDVNVPGSYTVSGLSTVTNALLLSGGVSLSGSLRNVQLKRNGELVGTLDLYDLLLRGDTTNDRRLLPGDVIFVPPVGDRVGVDGEVQRPAYYELDGPSEAGDLVRLAGGLTPFAFAPSGRIERISERDDRQIIDADLSTEAGRAVSLRDGDILRVFPVLDRLDDAVELLGHVRREAQYQWRQGLRLSDLLPSPAMLKPQADLSYVVIRRETGEDARVEVVSANLNDALARRGTEADPALQPRDRVYVFDISRSRGMALDTLVEELRRQAVNGEDAPVVSVAGQVQAPDSYPMEAGMRVSDLLRAGGGLTAAAFRRDAELTRYTVSETGVRRTELIPINLQAVLAGDALADEELQPYDFLTIRATPEWGGQETVSVTGEIRFPGIYPIKRGETLRSVIERAGGLTPLAFSDGSVFTRELLKRREEQQLDTLIGRLEADLAQLAIQSGQDPGSQQALALGQNLLAQLESTQATGRLVIDLDAIIAARTEDLTMRDGDQLIIPQRTQEVTVIGEVQYATSHLFDPNLDREDYIARSGGLTSKADGKRVYVVRASGEVVAAQGSRWLKPLGGTDIRAGDTIVVPLDADRLAPLTLWSSVTQIVYNLAIAVAAVNSF